MKLVSWTLCGAGREAEASAALDSVQRIADVKIVVDTAPSGTPSVQALGVRAQVRRWAWRDDFGAARNAALTFAEEAGATWSTMVDSDEAVVCADPAALRAYLEGLDTRVQVVLVHSADHNRERLFRHPCRYRFDGRTHEQFGPVLYGEQAVAPRELITWSELPKTAEQLRAKMDRDLAILMAEREEKPNDPRVLFYLGRTLVDLQRYEEAIPVLRDSARGGGTGGTWSCFLAAVAYCELKEWDRAIDACLAGMALDPGIAEFPWYAGLASFYAGRYAQAAAWARLALVHHAGSDAASSRIGFRIHKGLTWGPWNVLAHALRALGDERGAVEADQMSLILGGAS